MGVVLSRRFCIAPMMDWTDRWCRRFHRLLTKRALAFTEMVTAQAVVHGDRSRLLGFDPRCEKPLALQLGGSDPAMLARAARIGADYGYDEINLNVGCPSDRVQGGSFGACLMREPERVAACVGAMNAVTDLPVTVKCRLGVDEQVVAETLPAFVETVAGAGVSVFTIHARKAWLKGLSPKDNRTIPPLDYDMVRSIKGAFPHLDIVLNGGLRDVDHGLQAIAGDGSGPALDGMMLGRAAYETPWILREVDARLYGGREALADLGDILDGLADLVADARHEGRLAHAVTRHALGLLRGRPGARQWRRVLSQKGTDPQSGPELIRDAADAARWSAQDTPAAAALTASSFSSLAQPAPDEGGQ